MHVRKRGNTWYYYVTLGNRPDGRRNQVSRGGFATEAEAKRAAIKVLNDFAERGRRQPSRMLVRDYLTDRWLPDIHSQVKASTYATYDRWVRTHMIPHLGHLRLDEITPIVLNDHYRRLATSGRLGKACRLGPNPKPGLSLYSVKHIHGTWSKALADAVDVGLLPYNPASSAKPPKRVSYKKVMPTWSVAEAQRFLNEVAVHDRLYAFWYLSLVAGWRRGEGLALSWDCVDFSASLIRINRSLVEGKNGEGVYFSTPKSGAGRVVHLDVGSMAVLAEHRARQALEREDAADKYCDQDLVFATPSGAPMRPGSVTKRFADLLDESDTKRIRLHDVRHTSASIALSAGIHPKLVSDRLGHSSITVTMDTYSHLLPGVGGDAADRIAQALAGDDPHAEDGP